MYMLLTTSLTRSISALYLKPASYFLAAPPSSSPELSPHLVYVIVALSCLVFVCLVMAAVVIVCICCKNNERHRVSYCHMCIINVCHVLRGIYMLLIYGCVVVF